MQEEGARDVMLRKERMTGPYTRKILPKDWILRKLAPKQGPPSQVWQCSSLKAGARS